MYRNQSRVKGLLYAIQKRKRKKKKGCACDEKSGQLFTFDLLRNASTDFHAYTSTIKYIKPDKVDWLVGKWGGHNGTTNKY